ncbi:PDZ domain-containing protein [Colwellia hornerae]|uniref:PDZ domain-containing protein n=1 Tax=Colwellia hornerae TaxID=89402 RepID=A0A5C6QHF0_9GAMM|nr:PDZ domain-containing protein [Colwellia hornerae]TWX52432.1 PDZ domain-containing protein [Colwellia hornerae]TWX58261.1 PDZ domain-containing protein [Colwellia hornerae]TWX68394.1 PDZ domain-containing protein [Colwellia hornerae]
MSLVFKTLFTNKYSGVLLVLLLSKPLLAATPHTNECATLALTANNQQNQAITYQLLSHNNSAIDNNAYLDNSYQAVFIAPGQHSLKVRIWRAADYLNYQKDQDVNKQQALIKKAIEHQLLITVVADTHYQLLPINEQDATVFVLEKNLQKCQLDNSSMLVAKHQPLTTQMINSVSLPGDLTLRLYDLMGKLALENSSSIKGSVATSNIVPLRLMGGFGLIFDQGNDSNNNTMKVLTVHPFSVAHTLKLASGDVIVKVNNKSELTVKASPNQKFQHYVNRLAIGEVIEITVRRDNEELLLKGNYQPKILPESHYQINGIASVDSFDDKRCASLNRYFTGIKGYKIISHNGQSLSELYGNSAPARLSLSPGVHRFQAVFSPRPSSAINSRYSRTNDIAPRISGGSRVGEAGIKGLMLARTGSINGWFNDSTESSSSRNNRTTTGDFVLEPSTGRPLLNVTLNIEQAKQYKLMVVQQFTEPNRSFYQITSTGKSTDLDCDEVVLPAILPPLLTAQSLINHRSLTRTLQFELDQLLLAVTSYYQGRGINEGIVDIYREKKLDNKYGLIGKMTDYQAGYALLVKQVSSNSMASRAGLLVGDKILALNNSTFIDDKPREFLAGIAKLKADEVYTLLILRENKQRELVAAYQEKDFPAFYLSVDMSSVGQAQQALDRIHSSN